MGARADERAEIERLLACSRPFSTLPPAERRLIAAGLRLRRFSAGELVFSEGQAAEECWLVHGGSVRILSYYGDARLLQLERLGRGQLFGLFCRLGGKARAHQCTAVAEGTLAAVRISDRLWRDMQERCPDFARESCGVCAVRLLQMRRLVSANKETVEQRVARVLLRLFRAQGRGPVTATRQTLAVQAGTAIETVFRALARFRKRGWIETRRSDITVKDAAALAAMAAAGRRARPLL